MKANHRSQKANASERGNKPKISILILAIRLLCATSTMAALVTGNKGLEALRLRTEKAELEARFEKAAAERMAAQRQVQEEQLKSKDVQSPR